MDKIREAFEQLPEIKDSLSENIVFIGNKYTTTNEGFYDLVNWLNGGWYTWQSRQPELVDKDQRIHELNETSLDLEGQIYKLQEQLNEKDKRIESLIAQIEMSDFKDSLGHELKSNLAYLDLKALRGENANS